MIKRIIFALIITVSFAVVAFAQHAQDIPQTYGARLNGQGSAGMAYADGGMSMTVNPAGLANVENVMFEGTLTNMMLTLKAPVDGDELTESLTSYSALGLFGAGYRINEWLVAGLMLYTPSGGGAKYEDVSLGMQAVGYNGVDDYVGRLIFIEFGPAIAINLPGNLKIGFVYRINYAASWARLNYFNIGANTVFRTNSKMSGFGFDGYRIGLQWNPVEWLHVGAAYRSFVKIRMNGTIEAKGLFGVQAGVNLENDASTISRYADKFSLGATFEAIDDVLFISLDYGIDFYSRSEESVVVTEGVGAAENRTLYKYNDSHTIRFGVEYLLNDFLTLRCGYGFGSGAGNPKYHNFTSNGAPGQNHFWSLGAGFAISEGIQVNTALTYMHNEASVSTVDKADGAAENGGVPVAVSGDYRASGFYLSIGSRFIF